MVSQAPKIGPKVYLITGVSSGFGHALSLLVLKNGDHVVGTSRNPSSASSASSLSQITSLGGTILALNPASSEAEIKKVAEEAVKMYGRVDVLVNNADTDCWVQWRTLGMSPFPLLRQNIHE
jgi:NAD(P)-dependent dehydrogenase (short-subunit alcohol dehydrogenase family)